MDLTNRKILRSSSSNRLKSYPCPPMGTEEHLKLIRSHGRFMKNYQIVIESVEMIEALRYLSIKEDLDINSIEFISNSKEESDSKVDRVSNEVNINKEKLHNLERVIYTKLMGETDSMISSIKLSNSNGIYVELFLNGYCVISTKAVNLMILDKIINILL